MSIKTVMTIEQTDPGEWMLTVERGNGEFVQVLGLSDMGRKQLAGLLDNGGAVTVTFEDVTAA
jgi:hypothetical protein